MTYLKRAMMEHPDMDPKALVLFHCPFDFDLPLTACPDFPKGSPSAVGAAISRPLASPAGGSPEGDRGKIATLPSPPTLCYLCWNMEVPE